MNLPAIKSKLEQKSILYSEDPIFNYPTVIGYEKKFKWAWMATQLNTFIVASDCKDELINVQTIESHMSASFNYAKEYYNGWPRGLQSGLGVITILIGSNISEEAIDYCIQLKSGKKWAGFTIPVVIDSTKNKAYFFNKKPMWGRIYYPHFEQLIKGLVNS